jgi:transposase-like protein
MYNHRKPHLVDRNMEGTIEGLRYSKELWKAMTSEQEVQVLLLCKSKDAMCAVKLSNTAAAGSEPIPMYVSDQLATLTCAVQSLDSNREGEHQPMSHVNSPC